MKIHDTVSGALAAALSISVFIYASTLPPTPGQNVGPGLFPQVIAVGIMICAVMLFCHGLRSIQPRQWITLPDWVRDKHRLAGFLMVPASLVFYIASADTIGFIPAAFALLLGLLLVFSVKLRWALLTAVIGVLAIHFMFYRMLRVPLPWGWLEPLAW